MELSSPMITTPVFLGELCRVFHHCFFRCFHFSPLIFATGFSGVFIVDCIFSCHQLSLPSLLFCCFFGQVLRFCVVYRECYGFERAFFTLKRFFTVHSFPTFGTICFYQGFPGSQQFFLECCWTSH